MRRARSAEGIPRLIPVPNTVRVAFRQTWSNLEAYNIYNVLCPAPASAADLTAIATVFKAWWDNNLRAQTTNSVVFNGMELTALDAPGSPVLTYVNTTNTNGSAAIGNHPPQVAVCISFKTGLSGRSYRGRVYHAFPSAGWGNTGGVIAGATVVVIQGVYDNLRTRLIAAGYNLAVASLYSGIDADGKKIPRTTGFATPVQIVAVGNRLDTQRRRLPVENRA